MKWLYEHGFLTTGLVLFLMFLLGYPTYQMFSDITLISTPATAAYTALFGAPIIGTIVALFKWRTKKEDKIELQDEDVL